LLLLLEGLAAPPSFEVTGMLKISNVALPLLGSLRPWATADDDRPLA
jgi:hypothetical protein